MKSTAAILEILESRTLLSGNVRALLDGATLRLIGDEAGNQIEVDLTDGHDGTIVLHNGEGSINGGFGPAFFAGVRSLLVKLKDGDDSVRLSAGKVRQDLTLLGGRGNDRILLKETRVGRDLQIRTRGGEDTIDLFLSRVAGQTNIAGREGHDLITIDRVTFDDRVRIRAGQGDDTIYLGQVRRPDDFAFDLGPGEADLLSDHPIRLVDNFTQGDAGWQAGFADSFEDRLDEVEFKSGLKQLPAELGVNGTGYLLSGKNLTDDLFMFIKKRIGRQHGLEAGRAYQVRFIVTFASNAGNTFGVGGSPGESVYLKVGATRRDPAPVQPYDTTPGGMNIDIGDQGAGGRDASVAGNISNGSEYFGEGEPPYQTVVRRHIHPTTVIADANGELSLLVGFDSGFEATTTLYIQKIEVTLVPVQE